MAFLEEPRSGVSLMVSSLKHLPVLETSGKGWGDYSTLEYAKTEGQVRALIAYRTYPFFAPSSALLTSGPFGVGDPLLLSQPLLLVSPGRLINYKETLQLQLYTRIICSCRRSVAGPVPAGRMEGRGGTSQRWAAGTSGTRMG